MMYIIKDNDSGLYLSNDNTCKQSLYDFVNYYYLGDKEHAQRFTFEEAMRVRKSLLSVDLIWFPEKFKDSNKLNAIENLEDSEFARTFEKYIFEERIFIEDEFNSTLEEIDG